MVLVLVNGDLTVKVAPTVQANACGVKGP